MKNILITGGAGFIGSNLALKLIDNGYNITVIDNLSAQIHGVNPEVTSPLYMSIKDKVNFVLGDVRDVSLMSKVLKNQNVLVHLAAETGTGQSMYEISKYTDVNIQGTSIILDFLANNSHSIEKIVVASSRAIYGEGKYYSKEKGFVYPNAREDVFMKNGDFDVHYPDCSKLELVSTDEDSKIHPTSVYGITKQVQEDLVMGVCPTINIAPVAFRYQNVYGPGQSLSNPYTGILSIFSTRIKNNNEINIFEDGLESRDFVFIDDVVDATILGIENDTANGEVFNVGSGKAVDVLTVANTLVENYGIKVPITVTGNYRLGDIRHNYADISKISNLLGYKPKWSFSDGISKFTQWVNEQSIQVDNYDLSIKEMKNKGLYR